MIPDMRSTLIFFVNGKKVVDDDVNPEWTLLTYLRKKLRLCGTKYGCGEGGCGACTVMVSKYNRKLHKVIHIPVNACLAPVCSMHGLAVTTVEGIGSTKSKLHPVQERIAKAHGSQCGFCTPGIVMSMYTLLRQKNKPKMEDMETAFQGNLCRCTGYRPIIEGYKTFTEDWELMQNAHQISNGSQNGVCAMGDKCCKNTKQPDSEEVLFKPSEFTPYDSTQEPIFPPELKLSDSLDLQSLHFKGEHIDWYRPTQLENLLELKAKFPEAKIVVGNTEVGVEVKFKHFNYPVIIQPTLIPEMIECKIADAGVEIGASVTLQEMEDLLRMQVTTQPEYKTRIFTAIIEMLHWFAGKQIRSVAAVGGNIMTGSPISDLNPIFMAAEVVLKLQSKNGNREVKLDHNFFTGYRKNIVNPDEILVSVKIPYTKEKQYFYAHKQARRRDDDIAIVNSAINVVFDDTQKIKDIKLAFGGMAPTTVRALKTEAKLRNLAWDKDTLEKACTYLIDDLPLPPNAPGGMIHFRRTLTISFFFRTFYKITNDLNIPIESKHLSALEGFHYTPPKGSQYFQIVSKEQKPYDTIGRPLQHLSAYKQATGEAIYYDDIPKVEKELFLAFVYSSKAHANIISIDTSAALNLSGVKCYISSEDFTPGRNEFGLVVHDEEFIISKTVTSQYQIVGAVVADDQETAQKAARLVKIVYEDVDPVILTIEDAIKHESFYPGSFRKLEFGDVDAAMLEADYVLEGECRTGNQEHFYMETHGVLVVPKMEDDELQIYVTTQNPAEINKNVARALDIPENRVTTKVKRLGGGFGGKDTKVVAFAVICSIAARKLGRPIRVLLERDEDMASTGGRNPFLCKYKIGFNKDGKLIAYDVTLYCNGGFATDHSVLVMERAMVSVASAYHIPNVRVKGIPCKTNLPTNTAFRGFGTPQALFTGETMIREVAEFLQKDVVEVMESNLYKEGDVTYYKQTLNNCTVRRCWEECLELADFATRRTQIDKYNSENRWKKRGITIVPLHYGIAFAAQFLNQGGALILIYRDGSVLLSHGGVEMGQGLHTKMIQVASKALGIPHSKIHTVDVSTNKVPNTTTTGASSSSDLNGMAILNACEIINKRLQPIKDKLPNGTWEEWIMAAYIERISLSSTGFYKTPDICYDYATNTGLLMNYFVCGAAVTEVEIDCLTGDHRILRTDIVMDLGESLNPAIDIGQVEGGFVQGYGLFVLEEIVYSPNGTLLSKGPGTYKIPGFGDIPLEFNVSLLKGSSNPRAVYSSKAVGEPPLCLATSCLFAIKEAIKSARIDAGLDPCFKLNAPATAEKIRMSCQDDLTKKLNIQEDKQSCMAWSLEYL